jgi:hypothetical protein
MTIESQRPLKNALLAEYGHFADRRIKNPDRAQRFLVDDRDQGGLASDGQPFGWFCTVTADVMATDSVRVSLGGQIPHGHTVEEWMAEHGVAVVSRFGRDALTFDVSPKNVDALTELAKAFISIVKPPARYSVPSYKYACPRVADSLQRLHKVLASYFGSLPPGA